MQCRAVMVRIHNVVTIQSAVRNLAEISIIYQHQAVEATASTAIAAAAITTRIAVQRKFQMYV